MNAALNQNRPHYAITPTQLVHFQLCNPPGAKAKLLAISVRVWNNAGALPEPQKDL